jgi:DNA-binding NarL/FixJ family response regulator
MGAHLRQTNASNLLQAEPKLTPIRVLVVDDHEMVRQGLRFLLRDDPQLEIVGQAGDGYYALELAEQIRPHVALVDINMPVMNGIELCQRLIVGDPSLAVIMLTTFDEARLVEKSFKAGARGYVLKDVDRFLLTGIIRTVMLGGSVIDHRILSQLGFQSRDHGKTCHYLSAQQLNVLKYISEGYSNKELSCKLTITENTVKGYVQEILEKLNARNRAEAAVIALRNGWI